MSFKDRWREYLRTGEDQSGAELDSRTSWKQYLFEGELEVVQEPQAPEEIAALNQPLPPSEIPAELYHATRPPLLSSIAEQGLKDYSEHSRHGAGQSGVSFATELEPVATGNFGNLVLVFDGQELAATGQYEFLPHQDPTIDNDEAEIRAVMIDSAANSGSGIDPKVDNLGTSIPFHHCKKLIFLNPIPKFEKKWLQNTFPHLEIQIYRQEKTQEDEG